MCEFVWQVQKEPFQNMDTTKKGHHHNENAVFWHWSLQMKIAYGTTFLFQINTNANT